MATKQTKLVVGICTGGNIRAETTASLVQTLAALANYDIIANLLIQIGGYVDLNRNVVVDAALEDKADYVMFIDADMGFPPDGVIKLLEHKKDIVGANYNVRRDPASGSSTGPVTKMRVDGEMVSMLSEDFPTEIFRCYGLATGFMLISTRVFKKLKYPYFQAHLEPDKTHFTEDIDFCVKADKAGFKLYCDPTIKLDHIGSAVY